MLKLEMRQFVVELTSIQTQLVNQDHLLHIINRLLCLVP
ncbi:unnamed protein product [Gongylonema pulchrum]|uniref:Uncharacterized protein n=1 Tax=Gongylonema pulchrum TaxID=637853 RepID=A0A183EGC0_9BILA|nr:unnamed protein product [Gongylonema pulchrum]